MTARLDSHSSTPLYAQLMAALKARIDAGEWSAGALLPSESELCAEYGVSRITVARAMTDLARAGVVHRTRGRGTTVIAPAIAPVPLRPPTTGTSALAFLAPDMVNERVLEIFGGFQRRLQELGRVALLTSGQLTGVDEQEIETLLTEHASALAVCYFLLNPHSRTVWRRLRQQGRHILFVGTYDPEIEADRVVADNAGASALAVRHLHSLGHRRIAFFGPGDNHLRQNTAFQGRLRGYVDAMRSAGLGVGSAASSLILADPFPAGLSEEAKRDRLLAFLESSGATAAVSATDSASILARCYLDPAGLSVPDDLALVGISDIRAAALVEVPLTTVRIDPALMGRTAAEQLLCRLEGDESPPRETVIPVELIVRASCGAIAQDARSAVAEAEALLSALH